MPENAKPTSQRSTRLVPGRAAGQREDLVQRLRDLASNYPSGIGILKEFLQNADDAGATWVRFTLDLRHHRAEQLPDSRIGHLLGPALLVDSDQSFSEQDMINIQRIGAAGKIADAGKTGRFGLGFNTVYSITDYPSFATRDLIMTFDPYFDTVAAQGEEPGINWSLDALWRGGSDWPRAFDLPAEAGQIETTVFRLPLRSASQATEGRISRTPTHPDELKAILVSLAEWGERVVLFLRSVVHVEARVLHDGREESLADVRTTNVEEVRAARGEVLPRPGESADHVFARAAEEDTSRVYPHRFSVVGGGETTESAWMVCQGLFLGEQGEVLDAARGMTNIGEKAIPLGGAAMRVHNGPDGLLPLPTPGTLLCTLPIPQQLPIALALNGHWSLSSSRDHVRFGADKGEEAVKITWNKALAEVVVPAAVAELVAGIRDRLGIDGAAALYAALPDLRRLITPFDQALGAGLYRALAASTSIRVADAKTCDWRLPSEATLPPAWSQALIDTCINDGLDLAVPVPPEHVCHGLAEVDEALHTLTPAETLGWLKEVGGWAGPPASAPRACLRSRELVFELVRFCSEGGSARLDGAPLAWMHDGSLRTFGHGQSICLGGDAARSLFRSQRSWFLAMELEQLGPVHPKQATNFYVMTPKAMIHNLKTVLPKGHNGAWETPESEAWFIELYEWLAALPDLKSYLAPLKLLEMVPDSKGGLIQPGTSATPLLPPNDMGKALTQALHEHGVPIVRGSTRLLSAIRAFAVAAEDMVWDLTPNDVIDTLANLAGTFPAQSPTRPVLLRWFATAFERADLYPDALALLKDLPIWPTKDGRAVAASGEAVFLPDYEPPPGFTPVTLLEVEDSWRPLLKELGVAPLDLGEWIRCVFLKEYPNLDADRQAGALRWLRDKGMDALTGPDERAKKLREAVRKTPLIVSDDGALVPAADLYHPEAWEAVVFLGGAARFPDCRGVYSEQQEEWSDFFSRLHLHRHPLDRDVITRVEQLIQDLTPERGDRTEAAMLEVYDFLEKRWAKSSDNEETLLAKGLRRLAWIPTIQQPHHNKVALFRRPAARFVLPAEVYPSRLLYQGASQVAFFAGEKESSEVRKALGMPSEIRPEDALAHFIAVRDEWLKTGGAGLSSEAVGKLASAFYRSLGATRSDQYNDKNTRDHIKRSLANSACLWDTTALRFWKADQVFKEGASWLTGLRGHLSSSAQDGDGLDFLGRRERPEPSDLASVLRELAASHDAAPLPGAFLKIALRCWHELAEAPEVCTPDLPVPTAKGQLVAVEETLVDDASYWRDRLTKADLPWLHPDVPPAIALAAGAQRASEVIEERRTSWRREPPPDVARLCHDRQAHLEHDAFIHGVARLLAQANPDADVPEQERIQGAARLELVACGQISAGLICSTFGVTEPVGVEDVACLLDEEGTLPTVWVASNNLDAVALELGRALVRRLKEAQFDDVDKVNEASLEAILRCSAEQVERTLNQRRVPTLVQNFEAPDYIDADEAEVSPEDDDGHDDRDEDDHDGGHVNGQGEGVVEETIGAAPSSSGPHKPVRFVGLGSGTAEVRVPGPSAPAALGRHEIAAAVAEGTSPPSGFGSPGFTTSFGPTSPSLAPTSGDIGPGGSPRAGSWPVGARSVSPIDAPPRERQPLIDCVPAPSPGAGGDDGPRRAPTVPHLGQGGAGSKRRGQLLSYLESWGSHAQGHGDTTPARLATEQAALDCVDELERALGRVITPMAQSNEGYDREILVPGETEPRIVEVKGLGGAWDARGVRLTPAELRAAHAFGDRYWVYVVEYAKEPARRRLFRIRAVAHKVNAYCLDHGWAALDEPEAAALTPAPGLTLLDGDAPLGVIETVEPRGEAIRLVVVTESGEHRRLTWNPSRHQLQSGSS